jgi:hypothetical protein
VSQTILVRWIKSASDPKLFRWTVVMENNSDGGLGFRSLPRRYRPPVPQNLLNVFSEHATHSDD